MSTTEVWNDILAVNLSAAFHTMRHALPRMAEANYGRVDQHCLRACLVASVRKAPYVSAKFDSSACRKSRPSNMRAPASAKTGGVTINCILSRLGDTHS